MKPKGDISWGSFTVLGNCQKMSHCRFKPSGWNETYFWEIFQHCGYWRQLYYKNTYSIVAEKASLSHFDTQSQKIWEKRKKRDVLDIFMAAELKEVMVKPLPSLLVVLFYSLWHLSNPECIVCKWTCQPSGLSQIKYIHHHPSQIKARIDWNSANPRAPRTIFNPLKRRESRMFLPNLFTRCAKESWQTFYY